MRTRFVYKQLRSILMRFGLQITRHRYDLDSFFISKKYEDLLLLRTAECLDEFIHSQNVLQLDNELETIDLTREFYELYKSKTNKGYPGSMNFNSLLSLFIFMKHFKPNLIIESGVFIGQSTWALRNAVPNALIESFDIDLSNLQYKDNTVNFHECDWSEFSFSSFDRNRTVCFFDDHVDQVRRLLECYSRGFEYVLLDDNTPIEWLHLATHGAPMFDFIFFEGFDDNEVIEWEMVGKRYTYRVDLDYLRKGREIVDSHAKFPVPMLSQINGFSAGNPLTIVRLKKKPSIEQSV